MPTLRDHPGNDRVQSIILGESGSGKTGLLSTLANAGYRLAVLDFDNGLDILKNGGYLKGDAADRIFFETLATDDPASIEHMQKLINEWPGLGALTTWGAKDVLVIDSGTFMSNAMEIYCEKRKGPFKDPRQLMGACKEALCTLFEFLRGPKVRCNVIVNTHLRFVENDQGIQKAYPSFIGQAFPRIAGSYFNNMWRIDVKPGPDGTRVIRTRADSVTALKCSAPNAVKVEEPFDLASLFSKIKGETK